MKKQPIDSHPVDQLLQGLDAKIQHDLNESHWVGMQALLDENFPPDEEPGGGAAKSDSRPGTSAGKTTRRFKWIFLGGLGLSLTLAGTQWSVLAFQNSEINQEMNSHEMDKVLEENSASKNGSAERKASEDKLKSESRIDENLWMGNISNQDSVLEESNENMSSSNFAQQQGLENQDDERSNQSHDIISDSLLTKKQLEAASDSVSIKKKKFIVW